MIRALFKITPEPFGLDFSDRSIKLIKLSKRRGNFMLENFGEKSIKEGLLKDGVIVSEKKLADALKSLLSGLKMGAIKTPYVSCSLPEQKTYLRVVQLPKMSKEEVEEAIRWEVEANIPLPLKDVYFDWEIINSRKKNVDHLDIFVGAAPRELVDSYVKLFERAGLKLFSLEPESVALSRSIIAKDMADKTVMIVDIGLTHMCVAIYAGHSVRFASSVSAISGGAMNDAIADKMKVSVSKAEEIKKKAALDKKDKPKIFEALKPVISDLEKYLKEYIAFYEAHASHAHDGKSVSQIILSGGDAHLKGLEEHLRKSFKLPIEKADPWLNILEPEDKGSARLSRKQSLRYATAIGLAL